MLALVPIPQALAAATRDARHTFGPRDRDTSHSFVAACQRRDGLGLPLPSQPAAKTPLANGSPERGRRRTRVERTFERSRARRTRRLVPLEHDHATILRIRFRKSKVN